MREDVKMRRCFTGPHYWKNPALRRSREKKEGCGVRGERGVMECVVRMWRQGGMWRQNVASGGNAASEGDVASGNVSSECGVARECGVSGTAASGNAASRRLGMWRHNVSSASGIKVLQHLRAPCKRPLITG